MFLAALLELLPNSQKLLDSLCDLKGYLKGVSKLKIKMDKVKKNDIWVSQLHIDLTEKKTHRSIKALKDALNQFLKDKDFKSETSRYANDVLDTLITAEAEVHRKLKEKIHLHELSSVDTLIDILGVSKSLELLGAFSEELKIYCSILPLGGGTIKAAHGVIPVPAPATVKIIETSKLLTQLGPVQEEISTPTGVALLTNLNPAVKRIAFNILNTGHSIGQKTFPNFLNMLRIFHGRSDQPNLETTINPLAKYREQVSIIETNIDDISGECIGDFFDVMKEEDILDIEVRQAITKKNRPCYSITVLCKPEVKFNIIRRIISTLGTLGVRYHTIDRICIEREIESINLEINGIFYPVRYKSSYFRHNNQKEIVNIKPEYEDLRKIRQKTKYSIHKLHQIFFKTIDLDKKKFLL
ncbi:MAG: hypothetical protein BAJALOKI1v1_760005 [Promethearchaeota archaeon]|nr:MAG: hypothetical protein BAJALOKI1v1_760005 [Candidatus Lokiarchaeota archaeon]